VAKSDAEQQLTFDEFRTLHASLKKVAAAVDMQIV
jgi:3-deoxy-D-arabino-heptulosonate 7-phosphate (DAHP) synthase